MSLTVNEALTHRVLRGRAAAPGRAGTFITHMLGLGIASFFTPQARQRKYRY
jgi:hypothetical protein